MIERNVQIGRTNQVYRNVWNVLFWHHLDWVMRFIQLMLLYIYNFSFLLLCTWMMAIPAGYRPLGRDQARYEKNTDL